MAIDTTSSSRDVISSFDDDNNDVDDVGSETEERELEGRILTKSHQRQRARSYQQLLEDFHQQQQQSHAMRPGLLSFRSQSLGQMVVKKVIGMDGG